MHTVANLLAFSQEKLLALAPTDLPSFSKERYTAENERRNLADFNPRDAEILCNVYEVLLQFLEKLSSHLTDSDPAAKIIQDFVAGGKARALISQMREFGNATLSSSDEGGVARIVHDLRGGAFQELAFRLELFGDLPMEGGSQIIYFLVRDHVKIMRNCVQDLDEERFAADHSPRDHDVRLLVEKWSRTRLQSAEKQVRVVLHSDCDGVLCESCLEFSTFDRIVYNLINNAAPQAADGQVYFSILRVGSGGARSIRLVLRNAVSPTQRQLLQRRFGDDLGEIFRGGFSTAGSGLGLRICADFCARAYGVFDFQQGKDGGYFGAAWVDEQFTVWFHWPAVVDT